MILVTGATGHIGNVLVKKLYQLNEPIRLLIPNNDDVKSLHGITAEIFYGDIRDREMVSEAVKGCSAVFHLAGLIQIANVNKNKIYQVNVVGTKNIIDACLGNKTKLIYVSSVHAFSEKQFINEDTEIDINNIKGDYGKSKALATLEMRKAIKKGLDGRIVYPSGIIGPFDFKESEMGRLFNYIVKRSKKKRLLYFDGMYDFVDVRDVVEGLINVWKNGKSGDEYILSGYNISVKEIYEYVKEILGVNYKIKKISLGLIKFLVFFSPLYSLFFKKGPLLNKYSIHVLCSNSLFNNKKASENINFNPRPLYESIVDTIKWYKNNEKFILKTKYKIQKGNL